MFKLSQRSIAKLDGVDDRLVDVVCRAIEITTIDFAVIDGLRTPEKQLEYFNKGASHIKTGGTHVQGKAVDLMAYVGDRASWEIKLYDNIADAMKQAAIEKNVPLRWGAAWNIPDIRLWRGTMEEAMNYYVDERRKQGKRPFIDGPHFEIA
jgi:peptidoglycan L-alanyl-D-glutamate endopeptidase CwlK